MKMTGEKLLGAPRARVWEALNDAEVLARAIPGCEELIRVSATELTARVAVRIGPVAAKFKGEVQLGDLDPPKSYTISGSGKGGAAGMASGSARVHLEEDGAATRLSYDVEAKVAGKIAQLGGRLIDATAKKLADEFFTNLAAEFGAEPSTDEVPGTVSATAGHPAFWVLAGLAIATIALGLLLF